jgi:predicted dehydrogenase
MSKLRVGVVGAGWWAAANHIPLLKENPGVQLTAVCRLGADELEQVRSKFGFERGYEDYDEMLAGCQLDAVIVASPHHLHFEHAKKALEKGCHVLVEKPMTVTAESARQLEQIASSCGKVASIPHGWNFRPYTGTAAQWMREPGVGEILHVALQMASPAEALFSGQQYPGTEDDMFRPPASTWADPKNYGGYGWGQFSHILGLLFYIADDLEPEQIFAISKASSTNVDLYNAATIRFRGGQTASLSGAGSVPMSCKFQVDIRIFGSDGMLLFDVERERLELRRHDGRDKTFEIAPGDGDYICQEPVEAFVGMCLGKECENAAPLTIGRKSIEVVEALYKSVESGLPENV